MSWVLAHGDCDGMCSAALVLAARPSSNVFFTKPSKILEDLRGIRDYERVVICDIAVPETRTEDVLATLRELSSSSRDLLYIDHHPLPEGFVAPDFFIHSTRACAAELTYREFRCQIPKDMSRIAIYGAIGDYIDNTELIQLLLLDWDKRTLYFESGLLNQGLDNIRHDYDFKRRVVAELSRNMLPSSDDALARAAIEQTFHEEEMRNEIAKQVKTLGKIAYVLNIKGSLGKAAIYARAETGLKIGIAGEEEGESIDMSLRTTEEGMDLNRVLRRVAPSFGGTGGGHPKAAGATIPADKFQLFIKALDEAT